MSSKLPKSKPTISSDSDSDSSYSSEDKEVKVTKKKETQKKPKEKPTTASEEEPPKKKIKEESPKKKIKEEDGPPEYWELSNYRRVSISTFKGKQLVNIREYYQKDGEMLPGRKGISLNMDQWKAFRSIVDEVDAAL